MSFAVHLLVAPGYASVEARWSHEFALGSGKGDHPSMALGVDAFNLLNRVNFAGYTGTLSSPFFGQPVAALPARRVQFSAGLSF